jgi:phosphopantothenoylcysteine decarboxylase/phosphopantothenate--cysteine ligase
MLIPVGNGFLASGLMGEGRMAEPEEIIKFVRQFFLKKSDLAGKKVLITAGPTYESIDPVRFIGNKSSGKMGFAIAGECLDRGANVTLITGPVNLHLESDQLTLIRIQSAAEMYEATKKVFDQADIIILSAAVADFKPVSVAKEKIKKSENNMHLELDRTVDIAATLGTQKKSDQILIGFALETNDEINHAKQKLHKKNLDFIVLNSLNDSGAGFQHDTNKITILDKSGNQLNFPLKSKKEVASDIINYIISSQQ